MSRVANTARLEGYYGMQPNFKIQLLEKCPEYLAFVASKPCCVEDCGKPSGPPHHEPPKGMGGGGSTDFHAVPLCQEHHRQRHDEGEFDSLFVQDRCESARLPLLIEFLSSLYLGGRVK